MNKKLNKIVFFDYDENYELLFHYPTYNMLKIEKYYKRVISSILNGDKDSSIIETERISEEKLKEFKKTIQDSFLGTNFNFNESNHELTRITFLVTTNCNLKCRYCYANEGSYNYPAINMSREIAKKVINYFTTTHGDIPNVMFFGGETLINIDVIEFICNEFKELYSKKIITLIPNYTLITNGTLINKKALKVIEENQIGITVSIDGDKAINDKLRVYKNGKGTFDTIIKNIKKLQKILPEEGVNYEATYTNLHEKMGISTESVLEKIEELTGIKNGVIIPVKSIEGINDYTPNYDIEDYTYIDLEERSWEKLENGEKIEDTEFTALINRFIEKRIPKYICSIGYEAFTIAPNGDIFPCHMLTDAKLDNLKITNIQEPNNIISANIKDFKEKLLILRKSKNPQCLNCYAIGLCGFCPAMDIIDNGFKIPENFDNYCIKARENAEHFIVRMAKNREDKVKWENMQKSIELTFS